MRDPDGSLERRGQELYRRVDPTSASRRFLNEPIAREFLLDGHLVPFTEVSAEELRIERLPFVSAPFEWCDAQFRAAADLTLELSARALPAGYEMKDASAWNVIYDGSRPMFCDHLSFQPIRTRQWWAFGQFLRHFVFPLQVSHSRGLRAAGIFRLARDGLQAQDAKRLLGLKRFLTRSWPPLLLSARDARAEAAPAHGSANAARGRATVPSSGLHGNLYSFCGWALGSLARMQARHTTWSDYTDARGHYSKPARDEKHRVVAEWLAQLAPGRAIDFGANTGEFTRLAVEAGASVVAVEQDHECVTRLFLASESGRRVHPVLANLGDLCGGIGWMGREHPGLIERLRGYADVILMLAVIHHIAISESIPLDLIAELAAVTSARYAIVELIGEDDPMVRRLAAQRDRDPAEFALARQEAAFRSRFDFIAEHALEGTSRRLVLMRKSER